MKDSVIDRRSKIGPGSQVINSSMGKHSYCGTNCIIINCDIGAFCSIADELKVGLASHPIEWASTSSAFYYGRDSISKELAAHTYNSFVKRTQIGNDIWIGDGVHIKAGVKIGDGAIIGMGSVVTKDVASYEIVAGAPAKRIRNRFSEEICSALIQSNGGS